MSVGRSDHVLETDRLRLAMPQPGDESSICRYLVTNRAHLESMGPARPDEFYTETHWAQRIPDMVEQHEQGAAARFFVYLLDAPGEIIGQANLFHIARESFQCATLGYGVAEAHQGRGFATEACEAVVRFAFDELNIHRVQAGHLPENLASAAVLRKLGFVPEGYARDFLCFHGRWRDHVLTARVNPDWKDPDA
ncbi:MAG: GNAT family N-acetyltransferase [Planctomycetota bacterium]